MLTSMLPSYHMPKQVSSPRPAGKEDHGDGKCATSGRIYPTRKNLAWENFTRKLGKNAKKLPPDWLKTCLLRVANVPVWL